MISSMIKANPQLANISLPKVLVTGCAGSIGKMMQSVFMCVYDYDILGIDMSNRIQTNIEARNEVLGCEYIKNDYIFENDKFLDAIRDKKIDRIAHLAEVSREEANNDYQLAKKYNVDGTRILIQNIKDNFDLKKMHLFFRSDMSVYGDRTSNPAISVTDTPNPNRDDYYALTKLEAENLIKESGIPYTIFRFAPICDHLTWWVDLHPSFFYFDLDQKIEWITARDAAKTIKQAVYRGSAIEKQIYNIGGGQKLTMRHREFMTKIMQARGVMLKSPLDLDPYAFANKNLYGGYYTDSDYSNSMLGYRMQPIDTAYLRQTYRYPFLYRWVNQKIPFKYVVNSHYEASSHIYQSNQADDTQFLSVYFDKSKVLSKEAQKEKYEYESAIDQDEIDLKARQLRNAEIKADKDFQEAMKQRDIREAIEKKWRLKRQELIAAGLDPNTINLDEIDKLEAEDKLRQEQMGADKKEEQKEEKKELTEEEKIRQAEKEEEEREKEKRMFGY